MVYFYCEIYYRDRALMDLNTNGTILGGKHVAKNGGTVQIMQLLKAMICGSVLHLQTCHKRKQVW